MNKNRILDKSRAACAIESAAFMNPDMNVYYIFSTKFDGVNLKLNDLVEALTSYPNIHLRYANVYEISKGTKLEKFFERDELNKSSHPVEHASDVMRALTINRFGGLYLDTDVITLKSLKEANLSNYACSEFKDMIANSVIHLDNEEFGGKKISEKFVELYATIYNPNSYADNGPPFLTKAVKAFCNNVEFNGNDIKKCGNFTVFETYKCYPLYVNEWQKVFQDEHKNFVLDRIKEQKSMFFHAWNKMGNFSNLEFNLTFDSKSAYAHLAKTYCPKVYQTRVKYL